MGSRLGQSSYSMIIIMHQGLRLHRQEVTELNPIRNITPQYDKREASCRVQTTLKVLSTRNLLYTSTSLCYDEPSYTRPLDRGPPQRSERWETQGKQYLQHSFGNARTDNSEWGKNVLQSIRVMSFVAFLILPTNSVFQTFIRHQILIDDTEDADILSHLLPSIHFIQAELDKGRGVLVHCQAGVSMWSLCFSNKVWRLRFEIQVEAQPLSQHIWCIAKILIQNKRLNLSAKVVLILSMSLCMAQNHDWGFWIALTPTSCNNSSSFTKRTTAYQRKRRTYVSTI